MAMLAEAGPGLDMCELCGGEARATTVAVRRRLHTGNNFDLVTHVYLKDPATQHAAMKYIEQEQVLVVVMGPTCRTMGPTPHVNRAINPDMWLKHYKQDMPHVRFCGRVTLTQVKKGRHFICENPHPTQLWYEDPWPLVAQQPGVQHVVIDQCRVGQRARDGKYINKPTVLIATAA